jgi:hypothetical protein
MITPGARKPLGKIKTKEERWRCEHPTMPVEASWPERLATKTGVEESTASIPRHGKGKPPHSARVK